MTREEAIKILNRDDDSMRKGCFCINDFLAIEVLKSEEPCKDAVSRAEVIDELNRIGRNAFKEDTDYDNFFASLDGLPPVTPTRKKEEWIFIRTIFDKYGRTAECPSCHKKWKTYDEIRWKKENKFCPNCGADMREVEE